MPRFILKVGSIRDAKDVNKKTIHCKVKFQVTSLRTKSTKCEGCKAIFDESFCFGVPPTPKPTDICQITLREDLKIPPGTSKKSGVIEVPLATVFGGMAVNKWFSFDGTSGQMMIQVAMDNGEKVSVQTGRSRLGTGPGLTTGVQPDGPSSFDAHPYVTEEDFEAGDEAPQGGGGVANLRRWEDIQGEIEANMPKKKLQPPKASFQAPTSAALAEEQRERRPTLIVKPPMRTAGNQTDQLYITKKEMDALINRIPDPASFPSDPNDAHKNFKQASASGPGGDKGGEGGFGTLRPSDPWKLMMQGRKKGDQNMYPPGMRDPGPMLSPPQVAAMRATSAAWPEDEVEGILMYCERLQKENQENSIRLARQALTAAKIASTGLKNLSPTMTPPSPQHRQGYSPSSSYQQEGGGGSIMPPATGPTPNSSNPNAGGGSGTFQPQGGDHPTAQDWFDTFGTEFPVNDDSADVKTNLEFLYDSL